MDTNKLSLRLLAEGWTKEQTPPGCHPWNQFYGGWTYDYESRMDCVFETPCGLLYQRKELSHSGTMSYVGIDWTEENDCLATLCPRYSRTEMCRLNHPLLEERPTAGCHYEKLHFCAVHETDKPYSYEDSAQRVIDQEAKEKERLWMEFSASHHGRVCRHQSRYNRGTREWSMRYDPEDCGRLGGCVRCEVIQKDLSPKKGNVLCDEKRTWIEKGHGLFPDEVRTVITKGIKVTPKPVSLTVCEIIVKTGAKEFQSLYMLNRHHEMFFDKSLKIELLNFRVVERGKKKRDLAQDLRDIAAGVEVVHEADRLEEAKAQKRARREKAKKDKERRAKKKLADRIMAADDETAELLKRVSKWELGAEETEKLYQLRADRAAGVGEQITLFGGVSE